MAWFVGIFFTLCVLFFWLMIRAIKMNQRREIDPEYDARITRIANRFDPYYNFFFNLSMWAIALIVIYFIYLG